MFLHPSQKVTPPRLDKQANQTYVRKSAIALCPTGWQNFIQARSQEPRDENSADRNAELFWALFAQLFEQLFAQLPADVFALMNTQDDTAHAIIELHTAMQPIPGFGRESVFCYRQKFSFFSYKILLFFDSIGGGVAAPIPPPNLRRMCVSHPYAAPHYAIINCRGTKTARTGTRKCTGRRPHRSTNSRSRNNRRTCPR